MRLPRHAGSGLAGAVWGAAAARRRVALLAVAAILLQALVFAWHHHPLLAAGPQNAAPQIEKQSGPLSSQAADDACEICQVLHHQSATPPELAAIPAFLPIRPPAIAAGSLVLPGGTASGFHARAPPQA